MQLQMEFTYLSCWLGLSSHYSGSAWSAAAAFIIFKSCTCIWASRTSYVLDQWHQEISLSIMPLKLISLNCWEMDKHIFVSLLPQGNKLKLLLMPLVSQKGKKKNATLLIWELQQERASTYGLPLFMYCFTELQLGMENEPGECYYRGCSTWQEKIMLSLAWIKSWDQFSHLVPVPSDFNGPCTVVYVECHK